jgi:VCBS repeat-containing protein
VEDANDAPACANVSATTDEDTPVDGNLDCTDADGDSLTYAVVAGPANGDVTLNSATGSFTYEPDANFNGSDSFTYRANDGVADSNVATVTITVNAVNDAPVAADDAYSTDEDTTLTVAAPGVLGNDSDVDGDALEAVLVDDVAHGTLTLNADGSFSYEPDPNFNGSDSFTYKANDGVADSNVATVTITVDAVNDAPAVDAGDDVSGAEGSTIALDGTVSDVEGDDFTTAWTYAAGAGVDAGATCSFADATAVDTTITCTDDGTYTATLTATDEHGAAGSDTVDVTVTNAAPVLNTLTPSTYSAEIGTAVTVTGEYTDAGRNDTHVCVVDWDDGTAPETVAGVTVNGSGSCSANRTFTTPGVYTISMKVVDDDGGESNSMTVMISVFDPNGGFVTGGGFFNSPAGAYAADPSATGRANFGFHSKYQKGAKVPIGQTEFQFKAGDLKFDSDAYEWLVVSGARAQYKGTGRLNGVSGYKFLLTAVDGQVSGGGGADKFRIKITDSAGVVVYDNRIGVSDDIDAADPQTIAGGSIVIHKA